MNELISIPKELKIESIKPLVEQLQRVGNRNEILIDFSPLSEPVKPLPILILGQILKKVSQDNPKTSFVGISQKNKVHSYLKHIGFFDIFEIPIGKKIGEAKGSHRYIPIKKISYSDLISKTSPPYLKLANVIHEEASQIAKLILVDEGVDVEYALTFSIREIIRNVFEHSKSKECYLCGQRWHGGAVQIGIIDSGIGINASLSEKEPVNNDEQALQKAILPGVTRANINNSKENIFDNSGYGLYVLSELGRDYGYFTLGSGQSYIVIGENIDESREFYYDGTFVGLHLVKSLNNFETILDEIIYNGENEARICGYNPKASENSKRVF